MSQYHKQDLLSASEIARYVYCGRAWGYDQYLLRSYRRRQIIQRVASGVILLIIAAAFIVMLLGTI